MMRNYQLSAAHGAATLAVRSGQIRGFEGEHSDPIYATSSFVFESAAQAAARFAETEPGNIYSRFTNPTVRAFEQRLAALENGKYCTATASGMGAILTLSLAVLNAGDHVVISRNVFGSTINLFKTIFARFGINASYVNINDYEAWENSVTPDTKLFFTETPSNPLLELVDIKRLASIAKRKNVLLAVDNCLLTPALQKPLPLGADIVIHSATKFLDGQGRCVGGAIVTSNQDIADKVYKIMRTSGASMSPFNAWVFLKALETLAVRMKAHSANALDIAHWLDRQTAVANVYYPGLEHHPGHALAKTQQQDFGGVISFDIQGERDAAWRMLDNTLWLSITANLGDAKTTITHPASTTHARISQAERDAAGIKESLIRLSIGLENVNDIKADIEKGLAAA